MDVLLGTAGYIISTLGFFSLFLLLLTTNTHSLQRTLLLLASSVSAVWAMVNVAQIQFSTSELYFLLSETARNVCWFLLLISSLENIKTSKNLLTVQKYRFASRTLIVLTIGELINAWPAFLSYRYIILFHLIQSAIGLWLIEQLYRRTDKSDKWAIKPLSLGLGVTFAYDFVLYANGLLTYNVDQGFWFARGWVIVATVPLVLITARRVKQWSARIYVSRDVVYHSTLLIAAGIYLLVMAAAGYYIRYVGDGWGTMIQDVFFALGGIIFTGLFISESLRRQLKVFIAKHFYANKYDYREEWMRFASILDQDVDSPYQVSLNAIVTLFECNHGMLATFEDGKLKKQAMYNLTDYPESNALLQHLASEAIQHRWIVDIGELQRGAKNIPFNFDIQQVSMIKTFSHIVPVTSKQGLNSACFISSPQSTQSLNWEDRDLMTAISTQLSVYLNLYKTNQILSENQQFDAFNRMSAFLAHDLKNVLAQLQLLSKNATRHRDNPEFIDDAFETIESASSRLKKVVDHLRKKDTVTNTTETFSVHQVLQQVCKERGTVQPAPLYKFSQNNAFSVTADKERFYNILSHLVQNAQEATPPDGTVTISTSFDEGIYKIYIEDTGSGMTNEFIENRLFKPFDTTKGNSGMGIGAYDAKKFVEQLNGYIDVRSNPGSGSKFIICFPDSK